MAARSKAATASTGLSTFIRTVASEKCAPGDHELLVDLGLALTRAGDLEGAREQVVLLNLENPEAADRLRSLLGA